MATDDNRLKSFDRPKLFLPFSDRFSLDPFLRLEDAKNLPFGNDHEQRRIDRINPFTQNRPLATSLTEPNGISGIGNQAGLALTVTLSGGGQFVG